MHKSILGCDISYIIFGFRWPNATYCLKLIWLLFPGDRLLQQETRTNERGNFGRSRDARVHSANCNSISDRETKGESRWLNWLLSVHSLWYSIFNDFSFHLTEISWFAIQVRRRGTTRGFFRALHVVINQEQNLLERRQNQFKRRVFGTIINRCRCCWPNKQDG